MLKFIWSGESISGLAGQDDESQTKDSSVSKLCESNHFIKIMCFFYDPIDFPSQEELIVS